MATAGSATVGTGGSTLYDSDSGCTSFLVRCKAASSSSIEVNIGSLHETGEYLEIEPGVERIFRDGHNGITSVTGRGVSGNADIVYGIVAKTSK